MVKAMQELDNKVTNMLNASNTLSASAAHALIGTASTTNLISGNIIYNTNVLDMYNNSIINVRSIASSNGKWSIDEEGRIVAQEVMVKQLCIGDEEDKVCLTRDQIRALGTTVLTPPSATSTSNASTTSTSLSAGSLGTATDTQTTSSTAAATFTSTSTATSTSNDTSASSTLTSNNLTPTTTPEISTSTNPS